MNHSRGTVIALRLWTVAIVAFLFVPILLICLYAFNPSNIQSWPLDGLSTKWFSSTFHNQEMRDALWLSVRAGLISTAIALTLGPGTRRRRRRRAARRRTPVPPRGSPCSPAAWPRSRCTASGSSGATPSR